MILKIDRTILLVFICIFVNVSLIGQNTPQSDKVYKSLTIDQKNMLSEQQKLIDNAKIEFKNNLTTAQKKILHNKALVPGERSRLLRESLTAKQRSLIKKNKILLRHKRMRFRRSLTKKQMIRLRRFINDRDIHDRKRLVRRIRRLIRDNLNTDN